MYLRLSFKSPYKAYHIPLLSSQGRVLSAEARALAQAKEPLRRVYTEEIVIERFEGKGVGRKTVKEACEETGVDVRKALEKLSAKGIMVKESDTFRQIAIKNNMLPNEPPRSKLRGIRTQRDTYSLVILQSRSKLRGIRPMRIKKPSRKCSSKHKPRGIESVVHSADESGNSYKHSSPVQQSHAGETDNHCSH